MNLWLFGLISISSVFVSYGWAMTAWHHRKPVTYWNAALMVAVALDIGSIALAGASGLRAGQLLGDTPPVLFFTRWMLLYLFGLFACNTILVWVTSIVKGRKVSVLWPVYWASIAAWSAFVLWWGN